MDKFIELLSKFNNNSGQSIVEYSLIMAVLMGSLTVMGFDLYPRFIHAFQLYFDSFYFLLNLPIP
ncbi:MAG: hypothetical protein ACQES9_05240 [Myxococcota bacterium]